MTATTFGARMEFNGCRCWARKISCADSVPDDGSEVSIDCPLISSVFTVAINTSLLSSNYAAKFSNHSPQVGETLLFFAAETAASSDFWTCIFYLSRGVAGIFCKILIKHY